MPFRKFAAVLYHVARYRLTVTPYNYLILKS